MLVPTSFVAGGHGPSTLSTKVQQGQVAAPAVSLFRPGELILSTSSIYNPSSRQCPASNYRHSNGILGILLGWGGWRWARGQQSRLIRCAKCNGRPRSRRRMQSPWRPTPTTLGRAGARGCVGAWQGQTADPKVPWQHQSRGRAALDAAVPRWPRRCRWCMMMLPACAEWRRGRGTQRPDGRSQSRAGRPCVP